IALRLLRRRDTLQPLSPPQSRWRLPRLHTRDWGTTFLLRRRRAAVTTAAATAAAAPHNRRPQRQPTQRPQPNPRRGPGARNLAGPPLIPEIQIGGSSMEGPVVRAPGAHVRALQRRERVRAAADSGAGEYH
ncbi:hypothetical protein V492_08052, partial [Pseudogymnoascus sp. VKM F-4246]